MTRDQYNELRVGDECFVSRGRDIGRACLVVYLDRDDEICLIRTVDSGKFNSQNNEGRTHRLINWRELSVCEKERA